MRVSCSRSLQKALEVTAHVRFSVYGSMTCCLDTRVKLAFQPLSAVKFCQVVRPVAGYTVPLTALLVLKADS
jgi:hypothetical protein